MPRNFLQSMFRRRPIEAVGASGTSFFIFLVACAIGLLVWWYDRVNTMRWELLQTLLELPADIDRSRFQSKRVDKSFEALRPGTAEATFCDVQLRDYLQTLDQNIRRTSGPTNINGTPVHSYSPQSLAWTRLPLPQRVGDRTLQADGLLLSSGTEPSDIRVFCLAFADIRAWDDPSTRLVYTAKSCAELGPKDGANHVVVAVIDVSAKTLRIRVE